MKSKDLSTQPDEATPPWCVRLIFELNAADERATALVRGLTREQLNWTAASGVWSVGQCIEHLCVANEVYLGAMADFPTHTQR